MYVEIVMVNKDSSEFYNHFTYVGVSDLIIVPGDKLWLRIHFTNGEYLYLDYQRVTVVDIRHEVPNE